MEGNACWRDDRFVFAVCTFTDTGISLHDAAHGATRSISIFGRRYGLFARAACCIATGTTPSSNYAVARKPSRAARWVGTLNFVGKTFPTQVAYRPKSISSDPQGTCFAKRVKGVEPSSIAWKAMALPLSYTRVVHLEPSYRTKSSTGRYRDPDSNENTSSPRRSRNALGQRAHRTEK